jgi:hypothetical protein
MNRWAAIAGFLICAAASGAFATSPNSGEQKIVKNEIGCRDLEFWARLIKFHDQGDMEVVRREVINPDSPDGFAVS